MKELSLTEKKKAMSMDKIVHDSLHYFEENGSLPTRSINPLTTLAIEIIYRSHSLMSMLRSRTCSNIAST